MTEQPPKGTPVEGMSGWHYSGPLTPAEQYWRGLITDDELRALVADDQSDPCINNYPDHASRTLIGCGHGLSYHAHAGCRECGCQRYEGDID